MRVGDYVRTVDGFIAKLINKDNWYKFDGIIAENEYTYDYLSEKVAKKLIVKSSPNIIDLIEVGDVVHSKKDNQWWTIQEHQGGNNPLWLQTEWQIIEKNNLQEEIDGVITKEQMKQMEYKIGDGNE
jgi:hypothetical protein